MYAVARLGDSLSDTDTIASGSGNVFVNNLPIARLSDQTSGHTCYPPTTIASGSGSVFANNLAVARMTDQSAEHCCTTTPYPCDNGTINQGSGNVFSG